MSQDTLEMMQGQRIADPSEGGLGDALDKFFGDSAEPKVEPPKAEPPKAEPPKVEAPVQETPKQDPPKQEEAKKQAPEPGTTIADIDIDEEFTMGKEAPQNAPESFDEKAFDQETETLAQGLESKAGEKFKALRAELKEAKQKTVSPDVQKRIEELELKASEAEGLRKKVDELSNVSAKVRMESTEEFASQVKAPADALWGEVEKMAQRYEGDPNFLWKLVTSGNREEQAAAFKEHLSDFSEFDKTEVMTMIKSWGGILNKRDELLVNAQKHIDGLDARQAEEAKRVLDENRKNVQTILKGMWEKRKDVIPGLVDEDGKETPAYRDMLERSMAMDFTRATAHDLALASFSGVILKHMASQLNDVRRRLAEYEKEDTRKAKASPGTGSAVNNASSSNGEAKPQSFREMFANADLV